MSSIAYLFKQGFNNLRQNIFFSLASILTIAACVFLFSICCSIIVNVQNITYRMETMIGITVFFEEDASAEDKEALAQLIKNHGGAKEIIYTSAEDAWESFKEDYFGDRAAELSEAFKDDNPLAYSDSFEIFVNDISDQDDMAEFVGGFDIVREVNYLHSVVSALTSLNKAVYFISAVIIALLFFISVFLISNTINLTAHMRRHENEIMRYIGATNAMIRAPFVIEGTLIGLIGAAVPLAATFFIYKKVGDVLSIYASENGSFGAINDILQLVPLSSIFPFLLTAGLLLGMGTGFVVSFVTIRKHLRV